MIVSETERKRETDRQRAGLVVLLGHVLRNKGAKRDNVLGNLGRIGPLETWWLAVLLGLVLQNLKLNISYLVFLAD